MRFCVHACMQWLGVDWTGVLRTLQVPRSDTTHGAVQDESTHPAIIVAAALRELAPSAHVVARACVQNAHTESTTTPRAATAAATFFQVARIKKCGCDLAVDNAERLH